MDFRAITKSRVGDQETFVRSFIMVKRRPFLLAFVRNFDDRYLVSRI